MGMAYYRRVDPSTALLRSVGNDLFRFAEKFWNYVDVRERPRINVDGNGTRPDFDVFVNRDGVRMTLFVGYAADETRFDEQISLLLALNRQYPESSSILVRDQSVSKQLSNPSVSIVDSGGFGDYLLTVGNSLADAAQLASAQLTKPVEPSTVGPSNDPNDAAQLASAQLTKSAALPARPSNDPNDAAQLASARLTKPTEPLSAPRPASDPAQLATAQLANSEGSSLRPSPPIHRSPFQEPTLEELPQEPGRDSRDPAQLANAGDSESLEGYAERLIADWGPVHVPSLRKLINRHIARLYDARAYSEVDRLCAYALRASPDAARHVQIYVYKALAKVGQDRVDDAERLVHHAVTLAPDNAFCGYLHGKVLIALGRIEEATAALSSAALVILDACLVLARIYREQGLLTEALAVVTKYLESFPPDGTRKPEPDAVAERGLLLADLGLPAEAIQEFMKLPDDRDWGRARDLGLSRCAIQERRLEDASKGLDRMLASNPDDDLALYNKACVMSLMGKLDPALDLLERAVRAEPMRIQEARSDPDFEPLRNASSIISSRFRAILVLDEKGES